MTGAARRLSVTINHAQIRSDTNARIRSGTKEGAVFWIVQVESIFLNRRRRLMNGGAGRRNAHAIPLRFVSIEESVRISGAPDRWADGQGVEMLTQFLYGLRV